MVVLLNYAISISNEITGSFNKPIGQFAERSVTCKSTEGHVWQFGFFVLFTFVVATLDAFTPRATIPETFASEILNQFFARREVVGGEC